MMKSLVILAAIIAIGLFLANRPATAGAGQLVIVVAAVALAIGALSKRWMT